MRRVRTCPEGGDETRHLQHPLDSSPVWRDKVHRIALGFSRPSHQDKKRHRPYAAGVCRPSPIDAPYVPPLD